MLVILHALVFLLFLLQYKYNVVLATSAADCHERCEQSSGSLSSPGNKYHAMQGHSFKNFTLKKPFDCHLKCFDENCKCQAYQMQADRCELLDEDRFSAPDDFLPASSGYTYFDMHREFVNQVSWTAHCGSGPCKNKCCTQSPCYNEGTCTEICDHPKRKFNCTCSPKYIGRLCNKERSKSCKEQIQRNRRSLSGVYQLFDAETNSLFDEYCDFTSEDGFFWSLIESFSLANKDEIRRKPFFKDYPVNQDNFDWNRFRLSKSRMNITAIQSSHLRVTCNFNIDGLNYTDYLRARLSEIDIINLKSIGCKEHEYINIRGYSCYNCTTHFHQGRNFHAHIDSYNTPREECNAYFPDSVAEGGGEDNFGLYDAVNPLHRCSSNGNSTTQWWVGARY
ncbi:uncharacterized protein [Montipora foliosa]|uniref:uncharacterized protein n=1 Tax=Montipora foliosa TaxID=591990 RepID=UPI0035F1FE0B